MKDLIGSVFKAADVLDKTTESAQERQATLTERQRIDMSSDNWLSKSIRPLSLLILLSVVCIMALASTFGYSADPVLFGEIVLLLGSAFGFYFDSRKREKIAAQNAKANLQIEKLKVRAKTKQARKEIRAERRAARRAERKQEKED